MDKKILVNSLDGIGLTLKDEQIDMFIDYYNMLIEKNKVMNLTAITEYKEVVDKHFTDSLCLIKAVDCQKSLKIIDLGTGAGFPGIPLKIAFPELEITLLDSLNKRIKFLEEVCTALNFDKIYPVHARAEELAAKPEHRQQYDLCVSRAVANLATLTEYCMPFVKVGGSFISYKSGKADEELKEAATAIRVLGGEYRDKIAFTLPDTDIERNLIIIDKVKNTPKKYPRKAGTPSKEPIK